MKIIALSDCHFKYHPTDKADAENAKLLTNFLGSIVGKYDLMVLVGDIFDLWFDWKYTIVKQYFPLLRRLADIADAGCRIVYISGNHDFWFGDFLSKYLGCEMHPEGFSLETDGVHIRFEHGDIRTVNDLRYQLYRKLIRLNFMRGIFAAIHPDLALQLGTFLSRSSRTRPENPEVRRRKTQGLKNYAKSLIDNKKADIVVMGHSHIPELAPINNGYYANCGDWINHHTYLEIIAGTPLMRHLHEDNNN